MPRAILTQGPSGSQFELVGERLKHLQVGNEQALLTDAWHRVFASVELLSGGKGSPVTKQSLNDTVEVGPLPQNASEFGEVSRVIQDVRRKADFAGHAGKKIQVPHRLQVMHE